MPYYQVELFRTVQDQATVTVNANNAQEAELLAGARAEYLDWNIVEEDVTFNSTSQVETNEYTSMASILARMTSFSDVETPPASSSYTPLVNR